MTQYCDCLSIIRLLFRTEMRESSLHLSDYIHVLASVALCLGNLHRLCMIHETLPMSQTDCKIACKLTSQMAFAVTVLPLA